MSGRIAIALLAAASLAPLTAGCLDFDSAGVKGDHYQYVIDSFRLPTTAAESTAYGFDLDNDAARDIDNEVGDAVVGLFPGIAGALQASLDQAVATGELIMLIDVQTRSLADADDVGIRIFFGTAPSVDPCDGGSDTTCGRHLDGNATFTIDDTAPSGGTLTGTIAGGVLDAGPGDVDIAIALAPGTPSVPVDLIGAYSRTEVSETALSEGRVGGGITELTLATKLVPAIATGIGAIVTRDCQGTYPGCCDLISVGQAIVLAVDADHDCQVSREEITPTIDAAVSIDVDLLDGRGAYNPGGDGQVDAVSAGIAFTAVPASFPLP